MSISLREAQAMIDRACEHADVIGVPMNIAVVDGGGHLLAFGRMDGAILGSIEIALAKAKTSVLFNGPSEDLWEFCKLDVLDRRDIAAATAWDFDTFVSNAAIGDSGPMAEIPVDLVRRTFETNVFANLDLTQHVIRKWIDAGIRGRLVIVSSMGGLLTAYGLGTYCATKHALEAIAEALRDELTPTGITVQTINPGPYDTGFNDRIADTTYRWHDDTVNFTREDDIRTRFAEIMKGQFDPAEMIAKMTEVIGADDGTYRNVWPPAIEDLIKQVQQDAWTRQA